MKFQIYVSNYFSKFYLPFLLYREIIKNILTENKDNIVEIIEDFNSINNDENTTVIMNIYSIYYTPEYNILEIIKKSKSKIILINTEFYEHHNVNTLMNIINNEELPFYIFEYNIINYKYFENNYKNIKIYYIPLIYNKYLENYYNNSINNKISWNNKDIDIFFYGRLNDRRKNIIDILKKKYNVFIISASSGENENKTICQYIERSKIVLNILYDDCNMIFDYYRNSFLIANKILLVTEYPKIFDFNIEKSIVDIENNLILANYEDIITIIDNYLNNYNENDINNILEKQYNWFKKHDMKDYLLNFLINNF